MDDHGALPDSWMHVLNNDEHYEVIDKTDNSEMGIELVRDKNPDILLLDTNVRPIDGFRTLRMIRKFNQETKVIGVSVHTQPVYAKRMMREGSKAYITKGSDSEEFMHAINEVVKGRQYICKQIKDILAEQVLNSQKPTGVQSLSKRELEIIRYLRDGISS
jgi:DNA-binding NarL/FixJ family response regulator